MNIFLDIYRRPVATTLQLDPSNPTFIPLDKVKLIFKDRVETLWDKDTLLQLSYFKALKETSMTEWQQRTVTIKDFDSSMFNLVVGLVIDKRFIKDLVTPESFENPFFFEHLERILMYFASEQAPKLLTEIRTDQLPYLPLSIMEKIVKGYYTFLQQLSKEERSKQVMPDYVIAAQTWMNETIYFKNHAQAEEHFQSICDYQQEIVIVKANLQLLEDSLACRPFTPTQNEIVKGEIERTRERLKKLIDAKDNLLQSTKQKLTMQRHFYASKHIHHLDDNVGKLAHASRAVYANYYTTFRDVILKSLTYAEVKEKLTKEEMDYREELLGLLIGFGPDSSRDSLFLFEHYGMVINPNRKIGHPFVCKFVRGGTFGYHLQNEGPWYLEEEIRTDLKKYFQYAHLTLPPRLITDKTICKPASAEVQELRNRYTHQIRDWDSLLPSTKKQIADRLLVFNDWEKYGVKNEFINFSPNDPASDETRIAGQLTSYHLHQQTKIYLNLVDYKLVIETGGTNPDYLISHEWLHINRELFVEPVPVPL